MELLLSWSSYVPYIIVSAIVVFFSIEQIAYLKKKRFLPGPTLTLPFVGSAIALVRNPTKFWDEQSSYAKSTPHGMSANYILGRYMLYVYSTELSHKIFANVRPDAFHLIGHPFGKKLFGEHNLIYMFGQDHKDLRRRIAPNFTPRALRTYTDLQQRIITRHVRSWSGEERRSVALRMLCRDMNLETSQTVFVGPYLDEDARRRFNVDYNLFNVGLMKLPVDLPGFAFRTARLAVRRLVDTLARCAEASEERMKRGEEPTCLIDFWMLENVREASEDEGFRYSIGEIGGHLFDFLFASQDASTSSLLWAVALLDSHPHVLRRVRDEVGRFWRNDEGSGDGVVLDGDQLREMTYTEAVAREVARIRAPATLVTHVAGSDFRLTDDYVVPKGTIVFPSVLDSSFQGFVEPERFDPDRFVVRGEGEAYKRNYLVFGAGPHQCVGQRYAINHLMLFVAVFAALVDFERDRTDGCDELAYVPTIMPKDGCRVFMSRRRGV